MAQLDTSTFDESNIYSSYTELQEQYADLLDIVDQDMMFILMWIYGCVNGDSIGESVPLIIQEKLQKIWLSPAFREFVHYHANGRLVSDSFAWSIVSIQSG